MDITEKAVALQREVEGKLPDFVKMVRTVPEVIVLHQDAFAADYQEAEFVLLGKAVKYAGIFGKSVQFIGKNRETLKSVAGGPGN